MMTETGDGWTSSDAYQAFMGRWSCSVARPFIEWLGPRASIHWLDVGCGTGALTSTICQLCNPASIVGCDSSEPFIENAQNRIAHARVSFVHGNIENLPTRRGGFDAIVSGLVLNFIPEPEQAVAAMLERLCPGGLVAAYVWDYAEGMMLLRYFWDEAIAIDPSARELDEGLRFPLCRPHALLSLFQKAGLRGVETQALEIQANLANFDDYWMPFLRGTGPAPAFVESLPRDRRELLRNRLLQRIPAEADGTLKLRTRAWAVRGFAPQHDCLC